MVGNLDLKGSERRKEEEEREIRNLEGEKMESDEFSDLRTGCGLSALLLQWRSAPAKMMNRNWRSQLHSWTLLRKSKPQTPEQQSNKNNHSQNQKKKKKLNMSPKQILGSWNHKNQADSSPKWKFSPKLTRWRFPGTGKPRWGRWRSKAASCWLEMQLGLAKGEFIQSFTFQIKHIR